MENMKGSSTPEEGVPQEKSDESGQKNSALEIYKRQYLPMRKTSKNEPNRTKERLQVKSDIAHAIKLDDSTLPDHFEKLLHRIDKGNKESGEEFAARISDGISQTSRREPSLLETISATKRFDEIYCRVTESFGVDAVEVMRVGSSFWGRNYSVRGKEHGDASDIDLEIIVNAVPVNFLYPEIEAAFLQFQKYFDKGEADFCVAKRKIEGIEVSFHMTPIEIFRKICEFDYVKADRLYNLKEFRVTQQEAPKTYLLKNFAGDSSYFSTSPYLVDGGQITEVPFVTVGVHGELMLGVVLNKYLPLPELSHKNEIVQKELDRMVASLRDRKNDDKKRLPGRALSFAYFHAHVDQMPQWMRDQLKTLD